MPIVISTITGRGTITRILEGLLGEIPVENNPPQRWRVLLYSNGSYITVLK